MHLKLWSYSFLTRVHLSILVCSPVVHLIIFCSRRSMIPNTSNHRFCLRTSRAQHGIRWHQAAVRNLHSRSWCDPMQNQIRRWKCYSHLLSSRKHSVSNFQMSSGSKLLCTVAVRSWNSTGWGDWLGSIDKITTGLSPNSHRHTASMTGN